MSFVTKFPGIQGALALRKQYASRYKKERLEITSKSTSCDAKHFKLVASNSCCEYVIVTVKTFRHLVSNFKTFLMVLIKNQKL